MNIGVAIKDGFMAILAGSFIGGVIGVFTDFGHPPEHLGQLLGGTAALSIYGSLVTVPFVFLYGIPLHALLSRVGAATFTTSILFGGLPGAAWVIWTNSWGSDPALINGILIAIIYHWLWRKHDAQKGARRDGLAAREH